MYTLINNKKKWYYFYLYLRIYKKNGNKIIFSGFVIAQSIPNVNNYYIYLKVISEFVNVKGKQS